MFEKEAEEYGEKDLGGKYLSSVVAKDKLHAYKLGQYDGFVAGAELAYNKANEWYYPSKGELPQCNEETQLIFYVNCYYEVGDETLTRKRMVLGYYKKSFMNDDVKLFVEKSKGYEDEHLPKDVIAWKEIVLPIK